MSFFRCIFSWRFKGKFFACWVILHAFLSSADFFQNQLFLKIISQILAIRVSSSLDPDQVQQNVGPDLDPNCLQWLSADDTSRQRVNHFANIHHCCLLSNLLMYFHSSIICLCSFITTIFSYNVGLLRPPAPGI